MESESIDDKAKRISSNPELLAQYNDNKTYTEVNDPAYESEISELEKASKIKSAHEYLSNSKTDIESLSDIVATDFPEPNWVVPGKIPEGVFLFGGKPKMGKSWISLGLSIAVGAGGYAFGSIKVEQGKSLYLALEDNKRRVKKRAKLIADGVLEGVDICTKFPRIHEGGAQALRAWLTTNPDARLVIIDTIAKFREQARPGENPYIADYRLGETLLPIAHEFGVCILLVTHLRKQASDDDVMDEISGTTGLTGSVDGMIAMKRERGSADASLHIDGRDIEDSGEFAFKWDQEMHQWTLLGDAEEWRHTKQRQEILFHFKRAGDKGLTTGELATALNTKTDNIRQVIYRMCDDSPPPITDTGEKKGRSNVYVIAHHADHVTHVTDNTDSNNASCNPHSDGLSKNTDKDFNCNTDCAEDNSNTDKDIKKANCNKSNTCNALSKEGVDNSTARVSWSYRLDSNQTGTAILPASTVEEATEQLKERFNNIVEVRKPGDNNE